MIENLSAEDSRKIKVRVDQIETELYLFGTAVAIIFAIAVIGIALAIAPLRVNKYIRRRLAALIMWQWKKMSLLSARFYQEAWDRGNGE